MPEEESSSSDYDESNPSDDLNKPPGWLNPLPNVAVRKASSSSESSGPIKKPSPFKLIESKIAESSDESAPDNENSKSRPHKDSLVVPKTPDSNRSKSPRSPRRIRLDDSEEEAKDNGSKKPTPSKAVGIYRKKLVDSSDESAPDNENSKSRPHKDSLDIPKTPVSNRSKSPRSPRRIRLDDSEEEAKEKGGNSDSDIDRKMKANQAAASNTESHNQAGKEGTISISKSNTEQRPEPLRKKSESLIFETASEHSANEMDIEEVKATNEEKKNASGSQTKENNVGNGHNSQTVRGMIVLGFKI